MAINGYAAPREPASSTPLPSTWSISHRPTWEPAPWRRPISRPGSAELWSSGRRFEFGTRASTLYGGLGYALTWLDGLGWNNITAYIAQLSGALKSAILQRPYLHLLTPQPFEQAAGLTTFMTDGWNAGKLSQALWREGRMRVRVIPHYNALRISTAHYNNQADVDLLISTMDKLSQQGGEQ